MVSFDTTFLTLMFLSSGKPSLGESIRKVQFLLSELSASGEKILIPTPALSEILTASAKATNNILQDLTKSPRFEIAPFDVRAAVELAAINVSALAAGDKRGGLKGDWAKIKFDRQIVAISKSRSVRAIYSDDGGVQRIGAAVGLKVIPVTDINIPALPQTDLWKSQGGLV